MNLGHNYARARQRAQANANRSGQPRYIWLWNGTWRTGNSPINNAFSCECEKIEPEPDDTSPAARSPGG